MRRGLLAAVLAAAVLAPTAWAKDVTLKKGDVVLVPTGNLLCLFDSDDVSHKLEVGCLFANGKGPVPNSWGTGMLVNGTLEVVQFDAKGQSTKKKFRKTFGVAAATATYRLKPGDHFRTAATRIACAVRPGPVIGCLYIPTKGKKTTHEFVISNTFAGAFSIQLATNTQKTLYVRNQPKS